MVDYEQLIKISTRTKEQVKQDIKDCKDAFMLLNGRWEDKCFDYASKNKYDELLDYINKYYSSRIEHDDKDKLVMYLKKNKAKDEVQLVNELANSKVVKTSKNYRSVATKIVYFISGANCPIYDSNACNALIHINKQINFYSGNLEKVLSSLKNGKFVYKEYKKIIDDFVIWLGKEQYYQDLDKYLWIYGGQL